MIKTYLLIFALSVSCAYILEAQDIIFEEKVYQDSVAPRTGQNGKNFYHAFIKYGFVLGTNEAQARALKYGNSGQFSFGFRYKRKIGRTTDFLASFAYTNTYFYFQQDTSKSFPSKAVHESEKLSYNDLGLELAYRINMGKRGNIIKNYIDFAAYGNISTGINHSYTEKNIVPGAQYTEIRNYNLNYTNIFSYGAVVRVGYKKYNIYALYRLSQLFKNSYALPELSPLVVGLELGLF